MSETGDATNETNPSLFPLDKLAAADLYGPAGTGGVETVSASGVNSVSNWSWDATTETLTQTAISANETIHGTSVNDIIYGYDYGGSVPTNGTISHVWSGRHQHALCRLRHHRSLRRPRHQHSRRRRRQ